MCAFSPQDSALKLTSAEEAKTREMGHEELKEYLNSLKVEQGLVTRDRFSPDVLIPVDAPPRRQEQERLTKIFTINGKQYSVEGADESELVAAELQVHRAVLSGTPPAEATTVLARDEKGRFVSRDFSGEDEATRTARLAEWDMKFRTGQCDVGTYVRETGALDNYLEENFGLNREDVENQREISSWESSTKEFLEETEVGRHWPGGSRNLEIAQQLLSENPQLLENGASKVDALVAIAEHMRKNNLFEGEAEELTRARQQNADATEMSRANDIESIRLAAARSIGIPQDRNRNW